MWLKESDISLPLMAKYIVTVLQNSGKYLKVEQVKKRSGCFHFKRWSNIRYFSQVPIQSQFGLATQQETDWALEEFEEHVYANLIPIE